MQDRSLPARLKRLFSTDVVIRSTSTGQLKVADVDNIMAFGTAQTNSLVDRFTRLHKAGHQARYNPNMNYQTLRIQLYSDYEAMDTDGIISSVLDIIADECTLKGETGEVLGIRSSNENIQKILYNLFYDVMNIEFNLPMWIRSMCKYGDAYLKLSLSEKYGVFNVKPLSVYDIIREEGMDLENPNYISFRVDPMALAGGNPAMYDKEKYENYEIAHFRLNGDTNFLPYGRSFIEPARKLFKQLTLMEDAFLIHRIMRSPEKRIFYINVGNIPPNEVDNFIQKTINNMKKTPYIDPQTGDYNLKFNMQNMTEDFIIPVRGNDQSTRIDTAKGLEYTGMEDVIYLQNKMLAALKVPKAFLNYSDELNGKSTISALDLRFSRTIERIQKIVVSELTKIAMIHLYIQGYEDPDLVNFELNMHNPSIIYEQEKIALLKEKVDLAGQIMEKKLMSSDWIYDKVFEMSDDAFNAQRDLIVEDAKRAFRLNQIENEGNDPVVTGESYGTPHDLASLYGQTRYAKPDVPDGYDETQPVGRPKEKSSIIGTDDSAFGRDPLGKKGAMEPYKPENPRTNQKISAVALESQRQLFLNKSMLENMPFGPKPGKKVLLFEDKKEEQINLLDESNIKDLG